MDWLSNLLFRLDRHKPVASLPGYRDVSGNSLDLSALVETNPPDLRQEDTVAVDLEALWIAERVSGDPLLFESRKQFLRLLLVESVLDGAVEIHQDLLQRLRGGASKKWMLLFPGR